jgi:hypothetical protein
VRLWETPAPDAIPLELPARRMWPVAIAFGVFFVMFAAVGYGAVATVFGRPVDDLFDLAFLMFHLFWALGWSVGVLLLGTIAFLFAFYSESARIENGALVHIPQLGPVKILVDYDLAKIANVRLEPKRDNDADEIRVRFDYDGGVNGIGDRMPRADAQRLADAITQAGRFVPRTVDAGQPAPRTLEPTARTKRGTQPRVEPLALSSESAIALVVANAVPLAGVLFFGWSLGEIMVLYWAESGIIACYTATKMAIVGKLAAIFAVPFFIGHFGGFMAAHFLLIYGLFLRESSVAWAPGAVEALRAIFIPVWLSIAALFVSHGVSFYTNFIGEREYEGATVGGLMTAPYYRIIVMHLTLIFGGWIVLLIGTPTGALVLLLLLKTAADLHAHRREHAAIDR